jgi:hypothetical protein
LIIKKITITIIMANDDDIKINKDEDVGIDDKIKAGAKTLGKKWRNLDSD